MRFVPRKALPIVHDGPTRPTRRSQCVDGPRPCPWVSCRYHLAIDVNPKTADVKLNHPQFPAALPEETCVLDVANRGPLRLEVVGALLGVTRERVRQIEVKALRKLSEVPVIRELAPQGSTARSASARSVYSWETDFDTSATSVDELDDMDVGV